jgi:hypothetical protein
MRLYEDLVSALFQREGRASYRSLRELFGVDEACLDHVLGQQFAHPYTLARTLYYDALLCQLRRDVPAVRGQSDATVTAATAQRFALMQALGPIMRGWAVAVQEHSPEGLVQIRQGLDAYR